MTKADILSLIARMNTVQCLPSSSDSISWKAHREAETFRDASLFPVLREIICEHGRPSDKELRKAAYFILGKLLKNQFDRAACDFFLHQLTVETDKHIISSMLDRIKEFDIPAGLDIEPVKVHSKSEKWLIRHSAILALGSFATPESKEALSYYLKQEDEKAFRREITYANAALGRIGDPSDIPLLETHIHSRSRDIRDSAEFAIRWIQSKAV